MPADVSLEALVADVGFVVEELALSPVILIGQSLGGVIALVVAAQRPELMRALVLVDASPEGAGAEAESAQAAQSVGESLRAWPTPFLSRGMAFDFFKERFGGPLAAEAWVAGLERRADGWRPSFEIEVMVRTLREVTAQPHWTEWERIACPTLVVRAGRGLVDTRVAEAMKKRLPPVRFVEVPGAAHDVHLDSPREWQSALSGFLQSIGD